MFLPSMFRRWPHGVLPCLGDIPMLPCSWDQHSIKMVYIYRRKNWCCTGTSRLKIKWIILSCSCTSVLLKAWVRTGIMVRPRIMYKISRRLFRNFHVTGIRCSSVVSIFLHKLIPIDKIFYPIFTILFFIWKLFSAFFDLKCIFCQHSVQHWNVRTCDLHSIK